MSPPAPRLLGTSILLGQLIDMRSDFIPNKRRRFDFENDVPKAQQSSHSDLKAENLLLTAEVNELHAEIKGLIGPVKELMQIA